MQTIYAASKDITSLQEILKSESVEAINWFETNHIFAKPDKFQASVVNHSKNINENCTLKVNNIEIKSKNSVKLLDIETYYFIVKKPRQLVICNM